MMAMEQAATALRPPGRRGRGAIALALNTAALA